MSHNRHYEHRLAAIDYARNQPIFIASNIEDGITTNQIGGRVNSLHLGKILKVRFS